MNRADTELDQFKVGAVVTSQKFRQKVPIPTAIVKPKYQKAPFDDRQLPAVAYMNHDQPWYDKQNGDAVVKKINLPDLERKIRKQVKYDTKSAHNAAHDLNNGIQCASEKMTDCRESNNSASRKGTSGASVAVVQPRKKERMDERKLMETIIQMQIKKNSMDRNAYKTIVKPSVAALEANVSSNRKCKAVGELPKIKENQEKTKELVPTETAGKSPTTGSSIRSFV